jgi:GntR family transcriptional regulator
VLKENERLPTVRAMATELAINPNTIQRAYHELNEGYVYSIVGKGSFVAETKKYPSGEKDGFSHSRQRGIRAEVSWRDDDELAERMRGICGK